jgi:hypothetical protein
MDESQRSTKKVEGLRFDQLARNIARELILTFIRFSA